MLFTGLLAGFMSGLLGVGGGIIIVPVLFYALGVFGVDIDIRMQVAVASSLSTIVITSFSSARNHWQRQAVDVDLLKFWAPTIVTGVILGSIFADRVSGRVLMLVFAITALIVAANMIIRANNSQLFTAFPNKAVKHGFGVFIGGLSAMMGIGGGTLSVPILTAFAYDIRRAVGTASAIGFLIAIPGTITYVITGLDQTNLPPFSAGYVNLIALIAIAPAAMLSVKWGAATAHRIPRHYLSYAFGLFLLLVSANMFYRSL